MKMLGSRSLAALVVVMFAVVGCKKDGSSSSSSDGISSDLPKAMKPQLAVVDTSKLSMPALFANIPADTPYLLAAVEAVPLEYYGKIKTAVGPAVEKAIKAWQMLDHDNKVANAILGELDGKMNAAGLESLGFSSKPRFAIYGLNGVLPLVMRFEVKDDKVVFATMQRIASKAGETLPPMLTKDGRNYWRIAKDSDLILAFTDNQLVFAVGPSAAIDTNLDLILGITKPKTSMADGKALTNLMTKYGFGPHLVGYALTKEIVTQALVKHQVELTPACTAEIDRLSAKAPRFVVGYGDLTASTTSAGMILELAPDVIADLQTLKAEVPGLGAALTDQPLMAMGGGFDIAKGQKLGLALAETIRKTGEICALDSMVAAGQAMQDKLGRPLPDFVSKITGGVMSIESIDFGDKSHGSPIPKSIEGYAALTATDAKSVFSALEKLAPPLQSMAITNDGSLHSVGDGKLPLPFEVYAGVGDHAMVIAAGAKGKQLATKLIETSSGTKSPFFAMSYDYGKFLELQAKMSASRGLSEDLDSITDSAYGGLAKIFGRAVATLDITDKGLALWGSIEMK